MNSVKLLLTCLVFTCLFAPQSFAVHKDCSVNLHAFIGKSATTKIENTEWAIWNKKYSDIENARHREDSSGVWGFARLRDGIHPLHTHTQEEWYFIKKGFGQIQIGDKSYRVGPGESVYIPGDVKHSISKHSESKEDLVFEYFFPNVKNFEETVQYIWFKGD